MTRGHGTAAMYREWELLGPWLVCAIVDDVEFVDEGKVVNEYGAIHPNEFGGVYRDHGELVILFTRNLERRLFRLRRRLPFPDNVRVALAARPYCEVERENEELQRRLLRDRRHPGVTGVGITVNEGQFIVTVFIFPYDDDAVAAVKEVAAPYPVLVREMGPHRLVGASSAFPSLKALN